MDGESVKEQKSVKFQYFLIILCASVYACAQIARYSYTYNVTNIETNYGIDGTKSGLPTTLYFFAYAIGQIVNGFLCKKYNPRIVLSCSMLVAVVCNFLIFVNIPFVYINILWTVNGFAQSTLWPVLVYVVANNTDEKRKSFGAVILSMAVTVGTFLVAAISSVTTAVGNYRFAFLIAATLLFVGSIAWFFCTKNIKRAPDIQSENVVTEQINEKQKNKLSTSVIILLIVFAEFSFASYAVGGGLKSWVPKILKNKYNLEDWLSIFTSVCLPLFSIPTAFASAWLYKKTKDFALNILIIFIVCALLILGVIFFIDTSWVLIIVLFSLIYFSTSIITNHLTVQAPLYLKGKLNAGFLAGFFNGACYAGSAVATYCFGYIAEIYNWNVVFWITFILAAVSIVVALLFLIFRKSKTSE